MEIGNLKTIEGALDFIRQIEPLVKAEAYCFVGLCGGVLRNGQSEKDLDLIVIPMNGENKPDTVKAVAVFERFLGVPSVHNFNSDGSSRQTFQPLTFNQFRFGDQVVDVITL